MDIFFLFNDTATTEIYTLSLHDALPITGGRGLPRPLRRDLPAQRARLRCHPADLAGDGRLPDGGRVRDAVHRLRRRRRQRDRSEEHTSELQSRQYLVCRLLLETKKLKNT